MDGTGLINVDQGLYDLVVTSAGFAPVAKQVALDSSHPATFKFKMKVAECIAPYCIADEFRN